MEEDIYQLQDDRTGETFEVRVPKGTKMDDATVTMLLGHRPMKEPAAGNVRVAPPYPDNEPGVGYEKEHGIWMRYVDDPKTGKSTKSPVDARRLPPRLRSVYYPELMGENEVVAYTPEELQAFTEIARREGRLFGDTRTGAQVPMNPTSHASRGQTGERGLTYPGLEFVGAAGNAVRNFAQGATATPLQEASDALQEPSESVGGNFLDLLRGMAARGAAHPGRSLAEGLDAVVADFPVAGEMQGKPTGPERIGEAVPDLAPDTLAGKIYNLSTAAGSSPLNFVGAGRAGDLFRRRFTPRVDAAPLSDGVPALPVEPPHPSPVSTRPLAPQSTPEGVASGGETGRRSGRFRPSSGPGAVEISPGVYRRIAPEPVIPEDLPLPSVVSPHASPSASPYAIGELEGGNALGSENLFSPGSTTPSRFTAAQGPSGAQPSGLLRRAGEGALDVWNLTRSLGYSGDHSAILRQAAILGNPLVRPRQVGKAFLDSLKAMGSEGAFEQQQAALAARPTRKMQEHFNLYLADVPDAAGRTAGEEIFRSRLAEKIPVAGSIVKGSNRGFTAYLNRLRADVFDSTAVAWTRNGVGPESDPAAYRALADWINTTSGRADLGKLEKIAPVLQEVMASPRFQASRLKLLNPVTYAKMPPQMRGMVARDVAAYAGGAIGLLKLAEMGGAEVEWNPKSTDFGKIKVGRTRVDILGGFQPWVRFFAEVSTGEHKQADGDVVAKDRRKTIFDRARAVAHPSLSYLVDAWQGEDLAGRKFDVKDSAVQRVIPLLWQDFAAAVAEQGGTGALLATPGALGAGVTTYESDPDTPLVERIQRQMQRNGVSPVGIGQPMPGQAAPVEQTGPGAEPPLMGPNEPVTSIYPPLVYGDGVGGKIADIDPRQSEAGAQGRPLVRDRETGLRATKAKPAVSRRQLPQDKRSKALRKKAQNLKRRPVTERETITYPSRP